MHQWDDLQSSYQDIECDKEDDDCTAGNSVCGVFIVAEMF